MDYRGFLELLTRELYPSLHAEGFRGSGSTLRRINDPVIHVFNVQGSLSRRACHLNLGAHLSLLGLGGGEHLDQELIREYHCAFRARIESPEGRGLGWAYNRTPEEAATLVESVVSEWTRQGQPFFQRYASYPESFQRIVTEADPDRVHARDAIVYVRIAIHLGWPDRAVAFARAGLRTVPEGAILVRSDLGRLLKELGAA